MSFIVYDFKCAACGVIVTDKMVRRSEVEEQKCECGGELKRLPAGPITTFKFGDRAAIKSKKAVSFRCRAGE